MLQKTGLFTSGLQDDSLNKSMKHQFHCKKNGSKVGTNKHANRLSNSLFPSENPYSEGQFIATNFICPNKYCTLAILEKPSYGSSKYGA